MDRLLGLLKDYQVDTWCKQAAWIIVIINLVRLLIQVYVTIFLSGNVAPLSPLMGWSLLQALLAVAGSSLFDFCLLYAAAIVVSHLAGLCGEEEVSGQAQS